MVKSKKPDAVLIAAEKLDAPKDFAIDMSYAMASYYPAIISHCIFRASELALFLKSPMNDMVLDVGCGDGIVADLILERRESMKPPVVGFDISAKSLNLAKERNVYSDLVRGDASHLPFREGVFSDIYSVSVLEHIPSYSEVITEINRVLRDGGFVSISTVDAGLFSNQFLIPRVLRATGLTGIHRSYVKDHMKQALHVVDLDSNEWREKYEQAGFKVIQYRSTWDDKYVFFASLFGAILYLFPSGAKKLASKSVLSLFWKLDINHVAKPDSGSCVFFILQK